MNICLYLGLDADAHTSAGFPSTRNNCYRRKNHSVIDLQHQQTYCLSANHHNCPLLLRAQPSELRPLAPAQKDGKTVSPLFIWPVVALLFMGGLLAVSRQAWQSSTVSAGPVILPSASPGFSVSLTPSPSAAPVVILSPSPVSTSSPARTSVPRPVSARIFTLETPRATTPQLLIHRIVAGENFTLLEKRYGTSAAAIRGINYAQPSALWVGYMVVIALNTKDISALPAFEAYQVRDVALTLAQVSKTLRADLNLMARYNLLEPDDILPIDTWLLVPHPRLTQTP